MFELMDSFNVLETVNEVRGSQLLCLSRSNLSVEFAPSELKVFLIYIRRKKEEKHV